ncbi:hypothetical protein LCGC14_1372400 [marine sediment metagenome]|uniref:Uncharacterized protein n=1 Tax=marine sediment metagenome TaxID=412755 RepID=A0A0F9N722_9ZZZZ
MPFTRNTLQEIVDRIVSDLQTRITGATSLLRRSTLNVISKVNAGSVHLLYEYLDYQARQLFVSTADEAGLEAISSEYGITRKAAVAATGGGSATGTNGTLIPSGSELQSTDDQIYTTDDDQTIAAGTATLEFTASAAGEDGNDDAGITLTFVSPIAGINTSVTVDADGIAGGSDEEIDDDLRDRVLTRKRQPPHGGTEFDYEVWALEVSGVTRSWSFPLYNGIGTIGVAFVRDNDSGSIIPDATERATVRSYIVSHTDPGTGKIVGAPVTAEPGLFMIELSQRAVDFNIDISPNTVAVQNAIQSNLEDLITRDGGPGETLYVSRISEAISLASSEARHILNSPAVDITASTSQVQVLGAITFNSYV